MNGTALAFLLAWSTASARAAETTGGEDADLDRIPATAASAASSSAPLSGGRLDQRLFLEDALTLWDLRTNLLVPPPTPQPRNENRLSLDETARWGPSDRASLTFSDRLSAFSGDGLSWDRRGAFRNDLREAYASVELRPRLYGEAGRVNVRFGPAYGFNPDDFLKTRTQVDLASIDPSVLKENRLGTAALAFEGLFDGGSWKAVYSPRLRSASPLDASAPPSLDPLFGRTNSADRVLGAFSLNAGAVSPQALAFFDGDRWHAGANATALVSKSVVAYAEWAGVREGSLSKRAIDFGQATGSLSAGVPVAPQSSTGESFQNDAAAGLSWASESKSTIELEWHYHESGFTRNDMRRWVAVGRSSPRAASALWYVRQYASDQQEPLARQEVFLSVQQQDAFVRYLNLSAVAFVDAHDGSALTQLQGQYFISKNWTISLYLATAAGGPDTERGTIPWSRSAVAQVKRYF